MIAEAARDPGRSEANRFAATLPFALDGFQERALDALERGRSVLVAAPTGAGKTVVGEFACQLALATGTKCFYTSPTKALSNQKFRDLVGVHGKSDVGLLTGDRSVNGEAPIVVMTTEVLRNMIYERSSTLQRLRYVVLDEVHYLADRARGAVWEEVIIQLPMSVQIAALSATVSNAEEFGDWLGDVREGGCQLVIEESRPVPLRHHYFVNEEIHPTFVSTRKGKSGARHREHAAEARGGVPNPKVLMMERQASRHGRRLRLRYPSRPQVAEALARHRWLPAIIFVFSRAGCEQAVEQILRGGVLLTNRSERVRIDEIIEQSLGPIAAEDLRVLGFAGWRDSLRRGVAAHHAGLVPAFKEAVERAFQEGLLKIVVATETLALGINMPAKSVVIERLEKWDGERHVLLTPGEYTQLTGRAGRRGIDPVGHAIVLYQRNLDFRSVASLVGTRAYPLSSSFTPSYNMATNLLRRHDREHAERLLSASFAQFQADRSVAGLARRVEEIERGVAGYKTHLTCERGDWSDYWRLRREIEESERQHERQRRSAREQATHQRIAGLVPGDVVFWTEAPRRGLAAVTGTSLTRRGTALARVVTEDRKARRLGPRDVTGPPPVVATIALPETGTPRQPAYRGKVADALRELPDSTVTVPDGDAETEAAPEPEGMAALRETVSAHPCHGCPDRSEHERWQTRRDEIVDEAEALRRRIERQTGSLVRQLHRILEVLRDLGYLDRALEPTDAGMRLARIYADADLVVAECLADGVAQPLDAAELAGLCALFTFESRGDEPTTPLGYPTPRLGEAVGRSLEIAARLREREQRAGLRTLRDLDPSFVESAWRWARGEDLDTAIGALDLTGGDFVRSMKQTADLAGQLRDVGDPDLAPIAAETVRLVRRGVVVA